jgi:hypothetical protein
MPPKKKLPESVADMSVGSVGETTSVKKVSTVATVPAAGIPIKLNPNDSDRLQLAQAINNLVVRGDAFSHALEELNAFSRDKVQQLDLMIEAKKKEYQDITSSLENQYKDFEIKLKQNLQENKLVAVKEVLATLDMMPVANAEFTQLNSELAHIREAHTAELANSVKQEQDKAKATLQQSLTAQELAHKAEIASLKASVEQQVKEIQVLKETISNLKEEVAQQRALTKEVAIAGSKSQISQSFAK